MTGLGFGNGSPPVPQRPLNAAEILDAAPRVIRRNARAVFVVAVPSAIVAATLGALVALATYRQSGGPTLQLTASLLIGGVLNTVVTALLAPVVTADFVQRPVGARVAVRQAVRGGRGLVALALLAAVTTVAQTVGAFVFFVGGAWLWGIWAVAAPAMTVESVGPRAALRRSLQLVRTRFWQTWGVRALGWIVTSVIGLLIRLPFASIAAAVGSVNLFDGSSSGVQNPGLYITIIALGTVVSAALVLPIAAVIQCLLYADLRMRIEGLDIVLALPPVRAPVTAAPVSAW